MIATLSDNNLDVKFIPSVIILASAGQKQVDNPESVSHEIQDEVSVYTEIFVGASRAIKFDNVFGTEAWQNYYP